MFDILFIASHPAYYKVPMFQKISDDPDISLNVAYCTNEGVDFEYDSQFDQEINMGLPLLDGYNYEFLNNYSFNSRNSFWGQINPEIAVDIFTKNYDAVVIQGWNSFTNWLAAFSCFISGTPLFIRSESPLCQEERRPGWKIFLKKLALGKFMFKYASAFLFIGNQNRKFYKYYNVSEENLFFTPYAVDNDRFQKAFKKLKGERQNLRSELGIDFNDTVILFVGKLIQKKRPLDLLRAYHKLLNNNRLQEVVHLIFVGDGKLRSNLENYVNEYNLENVNFIGFINQTELPKYYTVADIFTLPSGMGETWGLVVNEAMNFRLPIVISDMPGSGYDLVYNKKNGYVFEVGDIETMTKDLKKLIINKERRRRFGEESLKNIHDYSYKKDVSGFKNALSHVNNSL